MSLVGSLEDLGLGDILQIVSLSRKSGVLKMRTSAGEGRIVLREGKVCAATVKGEPEDLRSVMVGSRIVDEDGFDAAVNHSRRTGMPLEEALCEGNAVSPEQIEVLRREHVEGAVVKMFSWHYGEFSFEVGGEIDDREAELLLDRGMNAEFLAIEATRLGDERSAEASPANTEDAGSAEYEGGEVLFSGEGASTDFADAHEAIGVAVSQRIEPELEATPEPGSATEHRSEAPGRIAPELARHAPSIERPGISAASRARGPSSVRLIAIDPELDALEWLKSVLAGLFSRIHIFQKSEDGVARIQQYLGRGETPVVLISTNLRGGGISGGGGVEALAERLHALAPRMPILVTAEDTTPALQALTGKILNGVVIRPPSSQQANRARWSNLERTGKDLRAVLEKSITSLERGEAETAVAPLASPVREVDLSLLVEVSAKLRNPAGLDVMSLVLDFAGGIFSRVVIFSVRDGFSVGLGQRGLEESGGPGDEELAELRIPCADVEWFRQALQERRPLRVSAFNTVGCPLSALLGPARPRDVFIAPVESGGEIVALLYADTLVGDPRMGDTSVVEVVLHQAGQALDRALLERALADA